jgi:hypothetical protein
MAPGSSDKTTDTHLDVTAGGRRIRLVALGTIVDDLPLALARIERENPRCIVGEQMPRAWRTN